MPRRLGYAGQDRETGVSDCLIVRGSEMSRNAFFTLFIIALLAVAALWMAVRQARARGRACDLLPIIADLRAEGIVILAGLAAALTEHENPTAQGASTWSPIQVSRILKSGT